MNDNEKKVLVSTWLAGVAEARPASNSYLRKFAQEGLVRAIGWTRQGRHPVQNRYRARLYEITRKGVELAKRVVEEIAMETCDVCGQASYRDLGWSKICVGCGHFVGMCYCIQGMDK